MDRMLRERRFWIIIVLGLVLGIFLAWLTTPGRRPITLLPGQDTTWRAVQSRGTWRVGMDPSFPPFESLDEDGQLMGYDVDLVHAVAELWGVEPEIIAIGYDSLLDALQTGQVDSVVSALPYDPRETRDFRFSEPYFEAGLRLAASPTSTVTDVDALAGKTLAVEWGSNGDMYGRRLQREGISVTLAPFETPKDVITALLAEDSGISAALVDNVTLRQAQGEGASIIAIGQPLESNPYVIASPYRAPQMAAQISAALEAMSTTGELAVLEARWFGAVAPDLATTPQLDQALNPDTKVDAAAPLSTMPAAE